MNGSGDDEAEPWLAWLTSSACHGQRLRLMLLAPGSSASKLVRQPRWKQRSSIGRRDPDSLGQASLRRIEQRRCLWQLPKTVARVLKRRLGQRAAGDWSAYNESCASSLIAPTRAQDERCRWGLAILGCAWREDNGGGHMSIIQSRAHTHTQHVCSTRHSATDPNAFHPN